VKKLLLAVVLINAISSNSFAMWTNLGKVTLPELGSEVNDIIRNIDADTEDMANLWQKMCNIQEVAKTLRNQYSSNNYTACEQLCQEVACTMSDVRIQLYTLKNNPAQRQQVISTVRADLVKSHHCLVAIESLESRQKKH